MLTDIKTINLGFLGVGWIGKSRMEAIANAELATIKAMADTSEDNLRTAVKSLANVYQCNTLEDLLQQDLDGVVIATPSALHALQSIQVLQSDKAVFCQKPLGRTAEEAANIVDLAREKNKLLGVDFSYRHTCYRHVHDLIQSGELGEIYAMELVFHNAYGPDKPWFYNPELAGGGCLIDLGVHLIDLALWSLDFPELQVDCSQLFSQGQRLPKLAENTVEDYATANLSINDGPVINISCSWNLPAGKEAEIQVNVYGTKAGAGFRNINGSFYDFEALKFNGTQAEVLFTGKDDWGGRAAVAWVEKLADGMGYDPEIESAVEVAKIIDKVYGR